MPRMGKSAETENSCGGRSGTVERIWGVIANGYGFFLGGDENVLKLIIVT